MNGSNIDTLPLILAKQSEPPLHTGLKDAVTLGLSQILSGPGKAAEISPLLAEEMLRHLHRKLHEATRTRARSCWFGGRWYNIALGANPDYVAMSGAHLKQVFALFDLHKPNKIQNSGQYALRADIARRAHDALGAQLGVTSDVLSQGLS